ncbi:MAG: glycosyltransferase family 39 protein [Planctomycetota bacterium]|jgi:hypothetical protein
MARRKKNKSSQQSADITHPSSGAKLFSSGLFYAIIITVILGGIPFGLGKYIELNSPGPFDSGAYVYSAKHLLEGAKLGVDEHASAKAGTLLANVIGVKLFGFNDKGPKIIQMILQLSALAFMFYTMRKVFGLIAASTGTIIAAVYLSAPLIAKFGNVKEQFMIPFMIAAACCWMLHECSKKQCWLVLCGAFVILPYYFKPTGLSIAIALACYLVVQGLFERKLKPFLIRLGLIYTGCAIGLCIPAGLFLWQGQLHVLWKTTPFYLLKISLVLLVVVVAGYYSLRHLKQFHLLTQLKKVALSTWFIAAVTIIVMLASCVIYISCQEGYMEGDTASYINDIVFVSAPEKVVNFITGNVEKLLKKAGVGTEGYLAGSRAAIKFDQLAPKVMRYYKALMIPILLAIASVIIASIAWGAKLIKKTSPEGIQARLVWLLISWWILDMLFVWVSPRSYEQYYLPLCASAAMLSGFIIWHWNEKLKAASFKIPWIAGGLVISILLGCLSLPIFIGQRYSPDTGTDYLEAYKTRRRGYAQALERVRKQAKDPWQHTGDYIRAHSTEEDRIYVWGWVPGIYVQAQRMSSAKQASFSDMHVTPPPTLGGMMVRRVEEFKQNPPRYIVDTRKRHIPWNRPPLELWPIVPKNMMGNDKSMYLPNQPQYINAFDKSYSKMLREKIDTDEAQRYAAMKPFRDYVMNHYRPVNKREFGNHGLYERIEKTPAPKP